MLSFAQHADGLNCASKAVPCRAVPRAWRLCLSITPSAGALAWAYIWGFTETAIANVCCFTKLAPRISDEICSAMHCRLRLLRMPTENCGYPSAIKYRSSYVIWKDINELWNLSRFCLRTELRTPFGFARQHSKCRLHTQCLLQSVLTRQNYYSLSEDWRLALCAGLHHINLLSRKQWTQASAMLQSQNTLRHWALSALYLHGNSHLRQPKQSPPWFQSAKIGWKLFMAMIATEGSPWWRSTCEVAARYPVCIP